MQEYVDETTGDVQKCRSGENTKRAPLRFT